MFNNPIHHLPRPFQTYLLPSLPFRRRRNSSTTSRDSTSTIASNTSTNTSPSIHGPTQSQSQSQPQSSADTYHQKRQESQTPYLSPNTTPSTSTISCSRCNAHLALTSQIISKGFTGRHGRAYLVSSSEPTFCPSSPPSATNKSITTSKHSLPPGLLPNTHTHKPVPRNLVTGAHTVSDVSCAVCGAVLGWKYVGAAEEAQRYKVGKFILETKRIAIRAVWEDFGGLDDNDEVNEGTLRRGLRRKKDREIEEDDDEEEAVVVFDSQDEEECEELFAGNWTVAGARRRRAKRLGLMR